MRRFALIALATVVLVTGCKVKTERDVEAEVMEIQAEFKAACEDIRTSVLEAQRVRVRNATTWKWAIDNKRTDQVADAIVWMHEKDPQQQADTTFSVRDRIKESLTSLGAVDQSERRDDWHNDLAELYGEYSAYLDGMTDVSGESYLSYSKKTTDEAAAIRKKLEALEIKLGVTR